MLPFFLPFLTAGDGDERDEEEEEEEGKRNKRTRRENDERKFIILWPVQRQQDSRLLPLLLLLP